MDPAARGRISGLRIRNLVAAVGLLGLALISGELAGQVPSTNKGLPVLTRIADIRRLTRDQASLGYPVLISAVVTYYNNEEGDFFIADREESIYVDDAGTDLHLHSGQSLQIEGYTDPGGYAPQIVHPKIRILGTGRLPRPKRVTFGDLISGKFDSQWVDLDGIVQSATQKGGRVELAIAGEGGRLSALVSGSLDARFLRLVDTKVRLQGACVSLANPKRQIFGTELNVPGLEYVHILEAGPPDPFQLPVRPIMTVLQFLPHSTYSHRIRIQGTVTMQRRGTQLYLQDQADSIYVDTSQPVDLKAGDRIDVAGFPEVAGYSPVLRKAVVRKIGSGPPPEPQSLTVAALRKFDNDTGLVRFQARLLERVPRAGDQTLILQDRGFVFNADLETIRGAERLASLKPGSLLQITGVCLVSTDENHVPQAFRILLRSGEDVVVLRSPSWWTLKRTLWAVGVLAAFILAALGWVVLLRRRVDEQTATIREQLRREAALKERYHELFENANDIVFTCGLRGHITSFNLAGERILGYSRPEAVGQNILEWVAPEYRAHVEHIIQSGVPQQGAAEIAILTKDGRHLPLEVSLRPIYSGAYPVGVQGIGRDITERKRAEGAMVASEQRYADLFENAHDSIFTTDLSGRFTSMNKAAERLTDYTHDEIAGMTVLQLVAPEYVEPARQEIARLSAGGEPATHEWLITTKDGRPISVDVSSRIIYQDGKPAGIQGIARDITERKRADEALRQAKELAESASRAKSDFLANMSHEIRTPMNGIMGMTELALDTHLDAEQREYLQMVKSSADSLLTVINDVLDFSKIEAGKFELDLIEFNLRDNLEQTIRTLALRAHQKGLELTCEVRPGVPEMIIGDPSRLRQIIINLVGNAIKFTSQGEVSVRVDLDSHLEDAVVLHFEVIDTGIGIPPEKLKVIFEAFAQADGSTTRKYGGTGLGLTISRQLVAMMRGHIWVESEVGRGSVFHFSAPFPLGRTTAPPQPTDSITLAGIPVLVVDDNATNRRILDDMLSRWRMKPTLASGGHAALDVLRKAKDNGESFPLVLTDAHMPGMDGFTLADCIRQDTKLAGAAIMMLTSGGQRGDAARCRELGVAAYLTKPIRQSELREAILTVLGAKPHALQESGLVTRHSPRERRQGLRVLLAEDNAVNQQLVVRLLEKRGHTVVIAPNGRVALEELDRSNFTGFDVVLMDIQMPEMGGYEATAAIREKEKTTGDHLPIIAMTAHALKGDRERCLASGMDGYVSKPIQVEDFFAAIEAVVQAYPGSSSPELAQEILNEDTLLERVEGDVALLGEMAAMFLQECPKHLSDIRQAVASCNSAALQTSAHTLKGSVSNFTAHKATQAALRLEMMGRDGDLTKSEPALLDLEQEIERLKPVLEVFAKGV